MAELFFDILSPSRKTILPFLEAFKDEYYLAGGTALALQLGHRDSIDFDFFQLDSFDTDKLFLLCQRTFENMSIQKIQEEKDTLSVLIDEEIKISFFSYPYNNIAPTLDTDYLRLASVVDIALMKMSAIMQRATLKDYVDLYFILKNQPLFSIIPHIKEKFPSIDPSLVLKSMVYFDDVELVEIAFKHYKNVDFVSVQKFLIEEVGKYLDSEIQKK